MGQWGRGNRCAGPLGCQKPRRSKVLSLGPMPDGTRGRIPATLNRSGRLASVQSRNTINSGVLALQDAHWPLPDRHGQSFMDWLSTSLPLMATLRLCQLDLGHVVLWCTEVRGHGCIPPGATSRGSIFDSGSRLERDVFQDLVCDLVCCLWAEFLEVADRGRQDKGLSLRLKA